MHKQILLDGFDACMEHHTCGNYINMSDVEGLEYPDIEWFVDTDKLQLVALTEFGSYHYQYDFDFDFDNNLNEFVSELREFLYNSIPEGV